MSTCIGSIGGQDMASLWEKLFKKIDSNNDSSISKTEFESAVSSLDKNQNSSTDQADTLFAKIDANGDGTLDKSEMMAALKNAGEQRRAHMPPPPDQNGQGPDPTQMAQDLLASLDTSGDGTIDKTEFGAGVSSSQNSGATDSDALFSKIDTNGDGKVDQSELTTGLKSMRPPMPPPDGTNSGVNSTASADSASGQTTLFADLIKSLNSSDQSESDLFSDTTKSLNTSSGSTSDDKISSLFSSLISDLQKSTSYGQSGSLSYGTSTLQSLLSTYA